MAPGTEPRPDAGFLIPSPVWLPAHQAKAAQMSAINNKESNEKKKKENYY